MSIVYHAVTEGDCYNDVVPSIPWPWSLSLKTVQLWSKMNILYDATTESVHMADYLNLNVSYVKLQ